MPWVERPTASLTYKLRDESGSTASLALDVPQTTLADAAITAAGVLRPLIEAITDCTVVSYSLTYASYDTTPPAPAAGSRVERKGSFTFRTAAAKTVTYQVPGIATSLVEPTGLIDTSDAAVAAFAGALIAVDAIFSDSNGVDLSALISAYERFRRSTPPMLPPGR